jgi:hypothetical protein
LASITIGVVWASSVHFKKGPTCMDNGLTATCTGTLAGLGNYDILAQLNTSGTGTSTCTNPGGSSKVPGQNPGLAVNPGGILIIPNSSVKNGTAPFTVTTVVPADPTPQAAGCPGNNWTASWADITFTGGTLNILQCVGGSINSAGFCVDSNGNDLGYQTALSTSVSFP